MFKVVGQFLTNQSTLFQRSVAAHVHDVGSSKLAFITAE